MIGPTIVHCGKNIAMQKIAALKNSLFGYIFQFHSLIWLENSSASGRLIPASILCAGLFVAL